jgi:hypothetical protein
MLRNSLYKPWFVDEDKWGFEIIHGHPFKGVIVQLKYVQSEDLNLSEHEIIESDKTSLGVEYYIISKPKHVTDEQLKGHKFRTTFDLIVNDILKEALQVDNDRNNNTKKSNTQ